jgi:hypothetical protein
MHEGLTKKGEKLHCWFGRIEPAHLRSKWQVRVFQLVNPQTN